MADTDDQEKREDKATDKDERSGRVGTKIGVLTWIIMAVAVVLLAGSGFVLGRLFAGSFLSEPTDSSQESSPTDEITQNDSKTDAENTWYYSDLESVVVNPDEPGATRFVRVGVILEISSELSEEKAKELIEPQKPPLINWLNLYFKSLTLGEMENDRDMKRILSQICDAFNEILFPDAKPQIKKVLIREFNIQ